MSILKGIRNLLVEENGEADLLLPRPEQLAQLKSSYNITAQATIGEVMVDASELHQVDQIYEVHGLADLGKSIFKVEEIKAPLPTSLPTEQLKQIVASLIPTTGLTVDQLAIDGQNRIVVLQSVKESFQAETNSIIETNGSEIANLQAQIEQLKQETTDRLMLNTEQGKIVDAEVAKVQTIVDFIS